MRRENTGCVWLQRIISCALVVMAGVAQADFDVARVEQSVARIVVDFGGGEFGTGTGIILNAAGDVATNFHVIDGARRIEVLRSGAAEALPAAVVWRAAGLDLAVVRARGAGLTPATVAAPAGGIAKGAPVYAMGFPGLADRLGAAVDATVTDGIISRFSREPWAAGGPALAVIQHTAAVNFGNSGGPLFDACGRVVGVNTKAIDAAAGHGVFLASAIGELTRALDANGIEYSADTAACTSTAATSATAAAANIDARLLWWAAVMVVALAVIFMLAQRKPRERIVRVVEGYSRRASRVVQRSGAKTHAPGVLLAGFAGDGRPLRICIDAAALNAARIGVSIGRAPALVDIPLDDAQVSRRHARFCARAAHALVEDLNSANGTRLNGKRLKPFCPAKVQPGDTVRLGNIELTVSALSRDGTP